MHAYITLHYITLYYMTLHDMTWHYITLQYISLHCNTFHYITFTFTFTLQYIPFTFTLHYITLHCIALHCITNHTIPYHTLHTSNFRRPGQAQLSTAHFPAFQMGPGAAKDLRRFFAWLLQWVWHQNPPAIWWTWCIWMMTFGAIPSSSCWRLVRRDLNTWSILLNLLS